MKSFAKFSVDSGWSWVVCVASFVVQFAALGVPNSFGTFFVAFLQEFQEGESMTAWVGSIALSFVFFCGPFVLVLIKRLGPRVVVCVGSGLATIAVLLTSFVEDFSLMFITYGVLLGVACSLCYFGSISGIVMYFEKHLSIAYGICLAGSGVGTPVFITVLDYLNRHYGWRMTFRGLVIVFGVVCLCGLTYLPRKSSETASEETNEKISKGETIVVCVPMKNHRTWKHWIKLTMNKLKFVFCLFFDPSVLKNKAFVVWTLGIALAHFGYFLPFVFLIRMAEDIGVPESESALLIAYMAITQVFCKIIFGKIGDLPGVNPVTFLQVALLFQGVATTLLPLATEYWGLVVYVIVVGVCDGCFSVMLAMGTCQTVGQNKMVAAIGHLYGVVSIPSVLGPPLAGLLYDKVGTYNVAFYLAGGLSALGVSLIFLVPWLKTNPSDELKDDCKKSLIDVKLSSETPEHDDCESNGFGCEVDADRLEAGGTISLEERRHLLTGYNIGKSSRPSSFIFLNMFIDNALQQCDEETEAAARCDIEISNSELTSRARSTGTLLNFTGNPNHISCSSISSLAQDQNRDALGKEVIRMNNKPEFMSMEVLEEEIVNTTNKREPVSMRETSSRANRSSLGEESLDGVQFRKNSNTSLVSDSGKSSISESSRDSRASLSSGSSAYDSGFGEDLINPPNISCNRDTKTSSGNVSFDKSHETFTNDCCGNVEPCLQVPVQLESLPKSLTHASISLSEPFKKGLSTLDIYSQVMESVLEQEVRSTQSVFFTEDVRGPRVFDWHRLPYTLSQTELHLSKSPETIV